MNRWNPFSWGSPAPPVDTKSGPRVEYKALPLGTNDALGAFLMFGHGTAATASGALRLYDQSTAVSIPVNLVAKGFSCLMPVLEINGEQVTDHPVLDLLRAPSPYYDGVLFMETIAKDYLITGETMVVGLGAVNRPPLELQPISPAKVSVNEGPGGVAGTMIVTGNTLAGNYAIDIKKRTKARYFDGGLRELTQIRSYSTKNNALLTGQSPLVSAAKEVRQHILGNTHNTKLLEKGGRLSLMFNYGDDMAAADFEEARKEVIKRFGGAGGDSIAVTVGGNLDVKEFGVSNKDMDFAVLQRMAQDQCALQYFVPLVMVSNDAATFDNYKQAKLALYDDAVLPLADRLLGGLSTFLLPRYGLDPARARITYDMDSITALATRRNEELKLRKELDIETLNEQRARIKLGPQKGGDVVRIPANLIPIDSDIFSPEPTPRIARDPNDD